MFSITQGLIVKQKGRYPITNFTGDHTECFCNINQHKGKSRSMFVWDYFYTATLIALIAVQTD